MIGSFYATRFQLVVEETIDVAGTLVKKACGIAQQTLVNHTSAPPFLWQYSAMSATIDWNDCVWQ